MKTPRNKRRIWSAAAARVVHERARARARHVERPSHYPTPFRAYMALRYGTKGTYTVPTWKENP